MRVELAIQKKFYMTVLLAIKLQRGDIRKVKRRVHLEQGSQYKVNNKDWRYYSVAILLVG